MPVGGSPGACVPEEDNGIHFFNFKGETASTVLGASFDFVVCGPWNWVQ
jgi:hypothetical protein